MALFTNVNYLPFKLCLNKYLIKSVKYPLQKYKYQYHRLYHQSALGEHVESLMLIRKDKNLEEYLNRVKHRCAMWDKEKYHMNKYIDTKHQTPLTITASSSCHNSPFFYSNDLKDITPSMVLQKAHECGALHSFPNNKFLAAKVNKKEVIDLNTKIERSCHLDFLSFEDVDGKEIFWHSAAHVLGQALEMKYQSQILLCDGPPLLPNEGFFYEMYLENGLTISQNDFKEVMGYIKNIVKEKQAFERLEVSKSFAMEMFQHNSFKLKMLEKIPENDKISIYRSGHFFDLCRGPHIPHTGLLKSFSMTRCGASHWNVDGLKSNFLQRVYGIAFPDKVTMKEWKEFQEEAKRRDHRVIGRSQGLFMFHSSSPGSAFFLPHGTRLFNRLSCFIRELYKEKNYQEVITPLIYKQELWETSGHMENYREDMFIVQPGDKSQNDSEMASSETFGLKPMNCPGHCLIFRESKSYSYRDLPVRYADFSPLHRNEASGALTGLTRVRRFHQDDAHIFCTPEQVHDEIMECLKFVDYVYGIFGFKFSLKLSTRPAKFLGSKKIWEGAEAQLLQALNAFGRPWDVNHGDGAFYGPKIDIEVTDALKRQHQCATIQLDFQLPLKFNLKYKGVDGKEHAPILIHRAILGSFERLLAILTEHTAGKWPLWMSPRQICIIPISESNVAYALKVDQRMKEADIYSDVSIISKTLNKRIREAQMIGYNYILVVGDNEESGGTVNVRTRDNVVHGPQELDDFMMQIIQKVKNFE